MAIEIPTCSHCGWMTFPPHLRCSRCGCAAWGSTAVARGVLEAVTIVERSLVAAALSATIGTVRIAAGTRLIARVAGVARAGDEVLLSADGLAVVATPVPAATDRQ
jgi:uncharacterized OB-fold protein